MPHITVQMFPGRSQEKKSELGEALARAAVQVLGVPEGYVSVSIYDVPEAEWDRNVYDSFMEKKQYLYKKPEYEAEQG